jgi:class 3 adenylate cyclase
MSRLRYPQKFALISLLFVLPLGLVLRSFWSETGERIAFTRREIDGVHYLRSVRGLLSHAVSLNRLIIAGPDRDPNVQSRLLSLRSEIDRDLARLISVDRALGDPRRTTPEVRRVERTWRLLRDRPLRDPTREPGPPDAGLLAALRTLIVRVGDGSNLILDPELASYYVMSALVQTVPDCQVLLTQIAEQVAALPGQDRVAASDTAGVALLAGRLQGSIGETREGLRTAFEAVPGRLDERLEGALAEYMAANGGVLRLVDAAVGPGPEFPKDRFLAAVDRSQAAGFALWDRGATELERLLQARVDQLVSGRRLIVAFALCAVALAAWLWWGFYASVMRSVSRLEEASRRMLDGVFSGGVRLGTRDELGRVAVSFNRIASRLREEWEQARAESALARAAEEALREREMRLERQNDVLVKLARHRSLSEESAESAIKKILESTAATLDVDRVSVWLLAEAGTKIVCLDLFDRTTHGHTQGLELGACDFPTYFAAVHVKDLIVADDAHTHHETCEFSESYLTPLGINSMLDASIHARGQTIGVVCHEHRGPPRTWGIEEQNFARSIADLVSLTLEEWERRRAEEEVARERQRADELLHVILPAEVVTELKETNAVQPRYRENVAVMFCDIVEFTSYCDTHDPTEVVMHLQELTETCEALAHQYGLEKIKTVGDAFMATAGLLKPLANPVLSCVQCGLEIAAAAPRLSGGWRLRVGIHTGPVIAGVVGRRTYLFDLWGDTVNTAARVESQGEPGRVNLTREAWERVSDQCLGGSRGMVELKGKGEVELFRVEGVRASGDVQSEM